MDHFELASESERTQPPEPLVALGWALTVALFARLVSGTVLHDPDSQLYETLARSLEQQPWTHFVAPIWPEGRAKSGIFVEHLACSLWPAALLGRFGIARGALVANFLWYLWATWLLHRLARALAGPQVAWAATFAWVVSPLSVQTLLRANHEAALTVAYLGALLCLTGPSRLRQALGLPLFLVLAVAIKGGLGLLVFPVALVGFRVLSGRRAQLLQIAWGLALTVAFGALYELWFRRVAGSSFFAAYLWSQSKGTASEQRELALRTLTNPLYYLANALWFAFPGSLASALDRSGPKPMPQPRRLGLWVFGALLMPLSLMARRALRYLFPAIALLALPGGDALCRRFPRLRDALKRHEARLPWLLMALLLCIAAARARLSR
jgi:hypothetical protein